MSRKLLCDLCGKEIDTLDRHYVVYNPDTWEDEDDIDAEPTRDLCRKCYEDIFHGHKNK